MDTVQVHQLKAACTGGLLCFSSHRAAKTVHCFADHIELILIYTSAH